MANANTVVVMDASIENVFKVLTDYETYAEFMDGVTTVSVLERNGNVVKAEYSLNIIKKFTYTLELVETEPTELTWSFVDGDFFKKNSGSWKLKDLGDGTTEVSYNVDVDLKMMVPSMVSKKLVKNSLPKLMESIESRAK